MGKQIELCVNEQGEVLRAFGKALNREMHNLIPHPDLLWQQMYNRLQWENEEIKSWLIQEFDHQEKYSRHSWLQQLNRSKESSQLIRTFTGHSGEVYSSFFSPRGDKSFSSCADGTVRVFNVEDGDKSLISDFTHSDALCCAISEDGKWLVSGHFDGFLCLWDADSLNLIRATSTNLGVIFSCQFTNNYKHIMACGSEGFLILMSSDSFEVEWKSPKYVNEIVTFGLHEGQQYIVAGCSDGALLGIGLNSQVSTYDVWGNYSPINHCCFSSDRKYIFTVHVDGMIRKIAFESREVISSVSNEGMEVYTCVVSPDDLFIATGGRKSEINIWETTNFQLNNTLEGHTAWVNSLDWDQRGLRIISGSADETVKLWDASIRVNDVFGLGHQTSITKCVFDPSGKYLATASADKTVMICEVKTHASLSRLEHESPIMSINFSLCGNFLVTCCDNHLIYVWDWQAGIRYYALSGHTNSVTDAVFFSDGIELISVSMDKTIRWWNVKGGLQLWELGRHSVGIAACAINTNRKLLVTADLEGKMKVWDLQERQQLADLVGHTKAVMSCQFDCSGMFILSAGFDGTVRLWEVNTGEEVKNYNNFSVEVRSCAISQDGSLILAGDWNKTIKVFNRYSGKVVYRFPTIGNMLSCAISPENNLIAAGDESGNLYLLNMRG